MWRCPDCERLFEKGGQSHTCTRIELGELFERKPDNMVLAFDAILQAIVPWEPNEVSVARHSIVCTSRRAWCIIKPMARQLDVKVYLSTELPSPLIRRITPYGKRYGHHIRISEPEEVTEEVIKLLRRGWEESVG